MLATGTIRTVRTRAGYRYPSSGGSIDRFDFIFQRDQVSDRDKHLHTRSAAGLFDVSHMGQIALRLRSGTVQTAALALESLVPIDVFGLAEGRQRYAFFTNEAGGILDDLMVANRMSIRAGSRRRPESRLTTSPSG
ncbi:MAG: hypothetical protein GEU91_24740 [Rhizobiales bacterium]|nr:hypothetical protein [Hyphomicrobiales bacterium]